MTPNEEIKESIKVVKWLRQELQHTNQFNTGIKAQLVIELNEIIKMLRSEDYIEDIPQPTNPIEREIPSTPKPERKSISLDDLKNI